MRGAGRFYAWLPSLAKLEPFNLIQTVIAILTAFATSLGVTSFMGMF